MLIFVYGTLKRGHYNHKLLETSNATFVDNFTTEARYTMYNVGFPVVCPNGTTSIYGELYEVNNPFKIFRLEGYTGIPKHIDNWYDVEFIDTKYGKALMFIQYKSHGIIIKTGVW